MRLLDIANNQANTAGQEFEAPASFSAMTMTELVGAGSNTDGTSYVTASISPTANRVLYAFIAGAKAAWVAPTSVTGNGLTWVLQKSQTIILDAEGVAVYAALTGASPTPGAVTFTFAASQSFGIWSIIEVANANISSTATASVGIANSTTNIVPTTSPSLSMRNTFFPVGFTDGQSSIITSTLIRQNAAFTPGAGYTELSDIGITHPRRLQVQWKNTPDLLPISSFTGSADYYAMVGLEVRRGL